MEQVIGSYAWTRQGQGKLSFKEKLKFIHRVLLPSTTDFLKVHLQLDKAQTDLDIHQILIPDTPLIRRAIEVLEAEANPTLIQHSWRSYLWGAGLGRIHGTSYDAEALLSAALYHDVGLTDAYLHFNTCQCFTLKSAEVFLQDATQLGYAQDKTQLVQDAICMHMNGYADEHNPSEVTLLQYGVSCDVIGAKLYQLSEGFRQDVLNRYPRGQFKQQFKARLKVEAQNHPHGRTALLRTLGLPMMLQMSPFKA